MSEENNPQIMPIGDLSLAQVEALHHRLNALLHGRNRIIRMVADDFDCELIRKNRLDLVRQAAKFISDVCGEWLKITDSNFDKPTDLISYVLRAWRPAFEIETDSERLWDEVIDELERLRFGDEPEILMPAKRPGGSHKQPAKLSMRRLSALQWAAFLKGQGVRPGRYKTLIVLAYGPDWDAIRHWKNSASAILGEDYVERSLEWARAGYGLQFRYPDFAKELHRSGARFRALVGLPLLEFGAFNQVVESGKI